MRLALGPSLRRSLAAGLAAAWLAACGGSGGSNGGGGSAPTATPAVTPTPGGPGPGAKRWPGTQWEVSSPAAQGMDATELDRARAYAFAPARNTQGVVVTRNGVIVAEWYADGADATTQATSWSMAKSFASTLVGIAIDRGEIASLDLPLTEWLESWRGTDKESITLRDLLEMRSGVEWTEATGAAALYIDEVDQLAFALDRPAVSDPGTAWRYSSADSMLIGGVIAAATGRPAHEYAQEHLFGPIHMSAGWWVDGTGHALTYCCIDAPTREYARLGLLFARGGQWNGTQVVSRAWVDEATRPLEGASFYALQWWTNAGGSMGQSLPSELFAARGRHSQDVYVVPSLDLVVVRNGTYQRAGEGPLVRTGTSFHQTEAPDEWDTEAFLGPIVASIGGATGALDRAAAAPPPASQATAAAAQRAREAAGLP